MNTEEQLTKIYNELEDMIDVQVYSHELRDDLLAAAKAVYKARDTAHRVITMGQPDKYGKTIGSARKSIKSNYHDKEIYRQAFGSLLEDYAPEGDFPGGYRVLVDGNYETEFSANSREEAIQKFKDYFVNKKKSINNSKKPIKSFRDTSNEDTSNDYGFYWDGDYIYDKDKRHWYFGDYLNGNTGIEPYSTYMQAVKETEDSVRDAFWEDEIPDSFGYAEALVNFAIETMDDPGKFIKEYEGFVKSSRKPIKSGRIEYDDTSGEEIEISKEADDIASTIESTEDLLEFLQDYNVDLGSDDVYIENDRVIIDSDGWTDDCSIAMYVQNVMDNFVKNTEIKDNNVKSSRKPIKSSLEDRLVPYLEEFEEGYSDALVKDSQNGDDFTHVYEDTFYEMFKSDYNLTDADIQKLEKAVRRIWDASSTEEGEVRDMGEMYGAPRGATSEEALKHFE